MGKFVNKRELSAILGISERSLTEWQGEGMPIYSVADARGQENTYDTEACIRWWIARDVRRASPGSSDDLLNGVRYKRELLALQREEGAVVSVGEIKPALEAWRDDVLATLLGLPEKYAQQMELTSGIDGKRRVLADIVYELREVMGSYDDGSIAGSAGGSGIPQPAADRRTAVG